mmetsp:Transcript_13807/g.30400  ORF Transcript_13807/g.30400 Transcript_13807/m.30400 type:complete len:94 (-) Transcript_13807:162-443(-)
MAPGEIENHSREQLTICTSRRSQKVDNNCQELVCTRKGCGNLLCRMDCIPPDYKTSNESRNSMPPSTFHLPPRRSRCTITSCIPQQDWDHLAM